jgi:hypothetical protein
MAKNAKNTASNTASKDAVSGKTWYERKKELTEKVRAEFGDFVYHNIEIHGARKYEDGTKGECVFVGSSKYIQPMAIINFPDGKQGFIQPRFMKKGKPIDAKRKALLEAEREAESGHTVMIPASVGLEREKAVQLRYKGWFKAMWFAKESVEEIGATATEGVSLYEVPAWKIKQEMGQDALDALEAKQAEFAKLEVK